MVEIDPGPADHPNLTRIKALLQQAFPDVTWHRPERESKRLLWHINASASEPPFQAAYFVAVTDEYLSAHREDVVTPLEVIGRLVERVRKAGKEKRILVKETELAEELP